MFDRLQEHFLGEPRRLVSLGVALTRAGGFLLVAGLVGSAATTAVSVAQGMAIHFEAQMNAGAEHLSMDYMKKNIVTA